MLKRLFSGRKKNNNLSIMPNGTTNNEDRAERLINQYGFDFDRIPKMEIRALIETEISEFQQGSAEYIRLLCGYLYCIGDETDIALIKKVKYGISFDVGQMIDDAWIENLEDQNSNNRVRLINEFISYYKNYFGYSYTTIFC